jgi:hypothetical protein
MGLLKIVHKNAGKLRRNTENNTENSLEGTVSAM